MNTIFTITSTKDNCWMSNTTTEESFTAACAHFNRAAWWLQTSNTPSIEKMALELLKTDVVLETYKDDAMRETAVKHSVIMRIHQVE